MLPTEGCRVCDSPPWSAAAAAGLGWWIVCSVHCKKKGVSACLVCKCCIASACACTVHSQLLQPFSLQKLLQKSHISAPARPTLRGTVVNGAPCGMDGRSDWAAALSCVQAH